MKPLKVRILHDKLLCVGVILILLLQGAVRSYDKENKYYQVIYEDDDSEEYTISELVKLLNASHIEEGSTPLQGRPNGKTRASSAKSRRDSGGRSSRPRDSSRRSNSRKSGLTKELVQRTGRKARLSFRLRLSPATSSFRVNAPQQTNFTGDIAMVSTKAVKIKLGLETDKSLILLPY